MQRDAFLKILGKLLKTNLKTQRISNLNEVDFDESLIALGIIDSLNFVEFLLKLEAETGQAVDFADYDALTLSSINGLISIYCKG